MATIVLYNGVNYSVPAIGEEGWGGVQGVDGLLISLATNAFNKGGGLFTLSSDVDFGVTAGLKSIYYKSRSANPSTSGVIRLGNAESIGWRNAGNSANLSLIADSNNRLTWDGLAVLIPAGTSTATGRGEVPGLALGNTTTGILKTNNTAGSTLALLLDGYSLTNLLWTRFPLTNATVSTTGDISSGSKTIATLGTTVGISVGMIVSGTGIPTDNMVSAISGATITMSGSNATATTVGVALTFTDPGAAEWVYGSETVPCGVSVSGNHLDLNSSDWSVPQDNYLICGNSGQDSLTLTGDYLSSGLGGSAIALFGRSHATSPQKTLFYNQGSLSGSISAASVWAIGLSGATTATTMNGGILCKYSGSTTLSQNSSGDLLVGIPAAAGSVIRLYGNELQFNEAATSAQLSGMYQGGGSRTSACYISGGISSPGTGSTSGCGAIFYGDSHATKGNYIEFYQGTSVTAKCDNNGSWTFGISAATQPHTFNGPVFVTKELNLTQVATPSNPASSNNKLYFKSDNNLYLLTSAGVETKVNGSAAALSVAAKTADYTILTSDDLVKGDSSGGTFTLTLPTAVGATGKAYYLKKTDSSTTAISIATTSAQTIDGSATDQLSTQNELLTVVSDGSNWQILSRRIPGVWTSFTPTFTGFGTATSISFWWRRVGSNLEVRAIFTSGITTGTEARISIPFTSATNTYLPTISLAGKAGIDSSAPSNTRDYVVLMEQSKAYVTLGYQEGSTSAALTKLNGNSLVSTGQAMSIFASIPINGWSA